MQSPRNWAGRVRTVLRCWVSSIQKRKVRGTDARDMHRLGVI